MFAHPHVRDRVRQGQWLNRGTQKLNAGNAARGKNHKSLKDGSIRRFRRSRRFLISNLRHLRHLRIKALAQRKRLAIGSAQNERDENPGIHADCGRLRDPVRGELCPAFRLTGRRSLEGRLAEPCQRHRLCGRLLGEPISQTRAEGLIECWHEPRRVSG